MLKTAFTKLFQLREQAARIRPGADDGFDAHEKPFLEHLDDLRGTLIKIAVTLTVSTVACFAFHKQIYELVQYPAKSKLPEIAPGVEHSIALSLDGWVTKSETLLLERGQVRDLAVTLERTPLGPREALIRIVVEPRDARVKVGDRWYEGGSPYELRVDARRWRVEIARSGFRNEEHDVELRGGQSTDIEYHLERERDRDRPNNGSGGNTPPPTPPPVGGGGPGTLTFAATPWCNVTIDGAPAGQTPIVNKSLPAGRHRIVCENPEIHVTRTVTVEIVSGQSTRQRIALQ